MTYFSMFSGIGGFELGISRALSSTAKQGQTEPEVFIGRERPTIEDGRDNLLPRYGEHAGGGVCAGFSEIDKHAIRIYSHHFPNHRNYGDATRIIPEQLPDFDLLVGGFPCQAFSIAGKRRGFEDTRGTLFFEIARIIRCKRPRHLLLENVFGLLSHDSGNTFETILRTLDEVGYDAEWSVLNSKWFGVPQNRERVFIVGHLRGECGGQVFPLGEGNPGLDSSRGEPRGEGERLWDYAANALAQRDYKGGGQLVQVGNAGASQGKRVYASNGIAECLTAQPKHGPGKHSGLYATGSRIRRLTPTECERLQAFPDGWTNVDGMKDGPRYKCLGNAVTVNVVEAAVSRMIERGCLNKEAL